MDNCEEFSENILPEKEDFYSHLKMEDITEIMCTQKKEKFEKTLKQEI